MRVDPLTITGKVAPLFKMFSPVALLPLIGTVKFPVILMVPSGTLSTILIARSGGGAALPVDPLMLSDSTDTKFKNVVPSTNSVSPSA